MITINNVEINTKLNEVTIGDFQKIMKINLDNSLDQIDRQILLITVLSGGAMSVEDVEDLDIEVYQSIVKSIDLDTMSTEIKDEFICDGKVFTLDGSKDKFTFSLKKMLKIRDFIQYNVEDYIANMMSLVYTLEGVNVKERKEIFTQSMTMDYVSPFLVLLNNKYGKVGK